MDTTRHSRSNKPNSKVIQCAVIWTLKLEIRIVLERRRADQFMIKRAIKEGESALNDLKRESKQYGLFVRLCKNLQDFCKGFVGFCKTAKVLTFRDLPF